MALVTPRITLRLVIRWLLVIALAVLFIGYIVWQSRLLLTGPVITLSSSLPATTSEPSITLEGTAENIVWIHLNGRPILTTAEGNFKERIYLQNGYTIVELEAADRYGRVTQIIEPVVFTPAATSSAATTTQ